MELTTNVPITESYVWSDQPRNTMKLDRSLLDCEHNSKLFYTGDGATQYRIINLDTPDKYGEYRSYRIPPSDSTIHLTVQKSSSLMNAAIWANYDLMVIKQKDTEPRSAHPYDSQDVCNPAVNFAEFFNGENLTQEDLVVWFNLGMHHVPYTGDVPNTAFTTAHSGVQFMPLYYYDADISHQTMQVVRIDYTNRVVSTVDRFGSHEDVCAVDLATAEPDLYSYQGDVVIRKFPYDPNNPYFETDSIA